MREHHHTAGFLPCSPKLWMVLAGVGALCLLCGTARTQDAPVSSHPPVFPLLFKNPTGMNAYEDWVYAADLVQNNQTAEAVLEERASLTLKRRLCNNPTVQQALLILHKSLDKPAQSPHTTIDENTRYLEFAPFRKLARLLATQIYVCFADGRIDAAMDAFSDGMRFGFRLQANTLITSLVGISIETIVLKSFSQRLNQLSAYQCSRLQRMAEDWLEAPSPAFAVLANDKQAYLQNLDTQRNDLPRLERMVDATYSDDEAPPPDTQALLNFLRTRPADLGPAMDRVKMLITDRFDRTLANLKLPVKERKAVQEFHDHSLSSLLFNLLAPTLSTVTDRYDSALALLRLLGVHAAIHRYKWEHNFLPKSLADLHISALNIDPYTDEGFVYKQDGATYDLSSLGPSERDAQGKATSARMQPVRL